MSFSRSSHWSLPALFTACFVSLSLIAGSLAANPYDSAGPPLEELRGKVRAELASRGIPATDIRLIDLKPRLGSTLRSTGPSAADQVVGYDAWVRVKGCEKGYVVLRLSRYGFVRNAYGQGACNPPGF